MGVRRDGRIAAVQVLYQLDIRGDFEDVEDALQSHFEHTEPQLSDEVRLFAAELCRGVVSRLREIDRLIERASSKWKLSRMSVVDRNILRLASFELLAAPAVPPSVVVDEAVEIAKTYGASESKAFVNGVLDRVWDQVAGRSPRPQR